MIELNSFITSLKINWVSRAITNCNDNWKYDIMDFYKFAPQNCTKNYDIHFGKVLGGIILAFKQFKKGYAQLGNNFTAMPVFFNKDYGYGRKMDKIFGEAFLGQHNIKALGQKLENITWLELTQGQMVFKEKNDLSVENNIELTNANYEALKTCFNVLKKRFYDPKKNAYLC